MRRVMPTRFWPLLPEVVDVDRLFKQAPRLTEQFVKTGSGTIHPPYSAEPYLPPSLQLNELAAAPRVCAKAACCTPTPPRPSLARVPQRLGSYSSASSRGTRRTSPRVLLSALDGQLFEKLLAEAGIDRREAYVTNTVKHFKWAPRGKRRLHSKPSSREIYACRPWLEAELAASARPARRDCRPGDFGTAVPYSARKRPTATYSMVQLDARHLPSVSHFESWPSGARFAHS